MLMKLLIDFAGLFEGALMDLKVSWKGKVSVMHEQDFPQSVNPSIVLGNSL